MILLLVLNNLSRRIARFKKVRHPSLQHATRAATPRVARSCCQVQATHDGRLEIHQHDICSMKGHGRRI